MKSPLNCSLAVVFRGFFFHSFTPQTTFGPRNSFPRLASFFLAAVCANKYGDNKKCKGNCRVKQIKLIEFQSTRNCSNNRIKRKKKNKQQKNKNSEKTKPQGEQKCINSATKQKAKGNAI